MKIKRAFYFESAHIVRNCSSLKCSEGIHGHSYKLELVLSSKELDKGNMVYDFSLLKWGLKDIVSSFDHSLILWKYDNPLFLKDMKKWSKRWVEIPLNPTAEGLCQIFFLIVDKLVSLSIMQNEEKDIELQQVIVHESVDSCAIFERKEIFLIKNLKIDEIQFSNEVKKRFQNNKIWEALLEGKPIVNPFFV